MTASEAFDADAVLKAGRDAYTGKQHKKALEAFTRVMKRCPCARNMKRERCRCKNFEAVAAKKGSIFHEAMYTCSCTVGKTFNKCDAAKHIRALDYRAATFEAMNELDRARLDAEWLLELAPRLPEGYLRLGKVARLQKKHEFAWHVYNAGIEAAESGPRSPLIEKLHQARRPLNQRFARRDPISHLPMEVLQMILSPLDFLTLTRCAQVCKRWRDVLTSGINTALWKTLHFDKNRRKVSLQALSALLRFTGHDAQALIVDDCKRVSFASDKLRAVMLASKKLARLEMRNPLECMPFPKGGASIPGQHIRHLVLDGFRINSAALMPSFEGYLQATKVLEHLELIDCDIKLCDSTAAGPPAPQPNLRYLRITPLGGAGVNLKYLDAFAPNLEQLWLEGHLLLVEDLFRPWGTEWRKLEVLIYQCIAWIDHAVGDPHLMTSMLLSEIQPGRLKHLDLQMPGREDVSHDFQLTRLQTLRLNGIHFHPEAAERVFGPSVNNETMHTFTIQWPKMGLSTNWAQSGFRHLANYAWLRGCHSITSLTIRGFFFSRWDDPITGEFPSFLASFPSLEELSLQESMFEDQELCVIIEGIFKACKGLKVLWQAQIKGVLMDRLVQVGKKAGVEIRSGEKPRDWPVKLVEDMDSDEVLRTPNMIASP